MREQIMTLACEFCPCRARVSREIGTIRKACVCVSVHPELPLLLQQAVFSPHFLFAHFASHLRYFPYFIGSTVTAIDMASSSSVLASTSKSSAEAQIFYGEFNEKLKGIEDAIQQAKNVDELQGIISHLSEARTLLTDKTDILPSYDQQVHEQGLRKVNEYLQVRRTELKPKGRFTFKRSLKQSLGEAKDSSAQKGKEEVTNVYQNSVDGLSNLNSAEGSRQEPKTEFDCIRDRSGEHIQSYSGKTKSSDLHLINLQDCIIDLRQGTGPGKERDQIQALQIRNLNSCVLFAGQIDGSVMTNECKDCLLVLECRQFRMHSSTTMTILLRTNSIATIEHCKAIQFGYANEKMLFKQQTSGTSSFPPPKVQDFDHISSLTPSPNWHPIDEETFDKLQRQLNLDQQTATEILKILSQ